MFLVCQNDSIRILPQFGSVKFFYIIKSMKLTKLGCYLLVFRANLRAFSYIFSSNNIYNGHMCVWKSHLEPRKKLIFLPQNQPCLVHIPLVLGCVPGVQIPQGEMQQRSNLHCVYRMRECNCHQLITVVQ